MAEPTRYIEDGVRPFVVEDDTGTAYVDPDGAELLLTSGDEVGVAANEEPPPYIREFVERETDLDPVGSRKRRYKEVRIDVGGPVLAAGHADPAATDGADGSATTAITEQGDAPRFYVTDDPDTGLGRRLLWEAFVAFLAAAILLAIAYWLIFI